MAIPGQEQINIGAENQITGSDSLYAAFHAVQNNFTELFQTSSPFSSFRAGDGVSISANASNGLVSITNTGVLSLTAGSGVTLSDNNGDITISAVNEGPSGVTRVGLTSSTLDITGGNIVSQGTFRVDLPSLPINETFTAGAYISPNITVDQYGRITSIANAATLGTVTSVAVSAVGNGIAISGGPITTTGLIEIENTGVTSLRAGTGILLSGNRGDITISATSTGTGQVSYVNIESTTLNVTGGPITDLGTFTIELPDDIIPYSDANVSAFSGNLQPNNITATGNITAHNANLGNAVTANYFLGNGALLTGITGTYSNSNVASYLPTYTGDITASVVTADDLTVEDNLTIKKTGQLFFEAQNGLGNYVSFIPPANPSAQIVWTLPNTLGSATQVLVSDAGTLKWTTPPAAGSNSYILFNDLNVSNGSSNLTFNKTTGTVSSRAINAGNITSNANIIAANITANANVTANDCVASNSITAKSGAYVILNTQNDNNSKFVALSAPTTISGSYILWALPNTAGNVNEYLTTDGAGQMRWSNIASPNLSQVLTAGNSASQSLSITNSTVSTTSTTGAVTISGGVGVGGNINASGTEHKLLGNLHITNASHHTIYVGPFSDATTFVAPLLIMKDAYSEYVQSALINSNGNGSADWIAYADNGDDLSGWADMGMTGSTFNDPNYTITGKNDGYFFVKGTPGTGLGGNLVIATADTGTHNDIVFGMGGFDSDNIFARMSHSTNTFSVSGNITTTNNITVQGHSYLGNIGNVHITGGSSGQVLSTDGTGELYWTDSSSGPSLPTVGTVTGGTLNLANGDLGKFVISNSNDFIQLPASGSVANGWYCTVAIMGSGANIVVPSGATLYESGTNGSNVHTAGYWSSPSSKTIYELTHVSSNNWIVSMK